MIHSGMIHSSVCECALESSLTTIHKITFIANIILPNGSEFFHQVGPKLRTNKRIIMKKWPENNFQTGKTR